MLFGSFEPDTGYRHGTKRLQIAISPPAKASKDSRLREGNSLHTGGVAGSIPASPTSFLQHFQDLRQGPLPCPPGLGPEQGANASFGAGETRGTERQFVHVPFRQGAASCSKRELSEHVAFVAAGAA